MARHRLVGIMHQFVVAYKDPPHLYMNISSTSLSGMNIKVHLTLIIIILWMDCFGVTR